jgi:eukaryotic-like serine/threonine-protein kinase
MDRFQLEAEVLASLDHTNIGAIYGLVDAEDSRTLVLALIEGQTLADRIDAGPIPIDEAVAISKQIIEALEYAHDRGVVHRDLKPANVKITPERVVKVLDFGLAKVLEDEPPPSSLANSPTLTLGYTRAGMILGTAAYMSPEQALGRPVDRRSDIFSFGAVLYEMLTGKRAFRGATTPDVLEAVVKNDPDWSKLPADTPGVIHKLLRRCLSKDRKRRLQAIGEARIALEEESGADSPSQALSRPPKNSTLSWAAAAGAVLLGIGLAALALVHFREEPPRLAKLSMLLPEKATMDGIMALSPDGRRLAFAAGLDGKNELWVRDFDSLAARPLPGTEGAAGPFWSPNSRSLGFFTATKLKRIDIAGGPALTLCDVASSLGGSWSRNDVIVFATVGRGMFRISAAGGAATALTDVMPGLPFAPWFLPDGRHFLYSISLEVPEKNGIYVGDIDPKVDSKSPQRVLPVASNAVYASLGYLLFASDRTLMAQPFDEAKFQTTGEAMPIAQHVTSLFGLLNLFSVSQNGVLAYISGAVGGKLQLTWVDRSGKVAGKVGPPGVYDNFRLAPDEKRIAFDRTDPQSGNNDVWVMDLIRGTTSRLTFDLAADNLPIWSPDGLRILYPNRRSGAFDLYVKSAAGTGQEEVLVKLGTPTGWGTNWSRDGHFILYEIPGANTGEDLWVAPQFGDRKPFPYLQTQFNESHGSFSPDGRWVAYVSDESGRNEIYVQAFPLSGAKFQISTGGGTEPTWRKDGTELFYVAADRNLMTVPIKLAATLEAGAPKSLFPITLTEDQHSFAVANDGQRFLIGTSAGGEKALPMTVVLNWQAVLKK